MESEESYLRRFFSQFVFLRSYFVWPNGSGIRLAIALFFGVVLTLFIHLRDERVDFLEVGAPAPSYVVAQRDFSFPDEESTIRHKERAVRDVNRIYWVSKKQIDATRASFDQHWMQDREMGRDRLGELHLAGEVLTDWLIRVRFTDGPTRRKMDEAKLSTDEVFLLRPGANLEEKLPAGFWVDAEKVALSGKGFSKDVKQYLVSYFSGVTWQLSEDSRTEMKLRQVLQTAVPKQMTRVRAGEQIVDQGERVSHNHVAQIKAMEQAMRDHRHLWHSITLLGSLLLAGVFIVGIYIFLRLRNSDTLGSSKKLLLYGLIVTLALSIGKVTVAFLRQHPNALIDYVHYPLFVPFAVILVCVLLREMSIAIFSIVLLTVLFSMILPVDTETFLVVNLIGSMFCLFNVRSIRKRTEIFSMCAKAWVGCAVIVFGFNGMGGALWTPTTLSSLVSLAFFMGLTGVLCVGLLPLLESMFQIMTNITLMEYIDPGNELLRRLSVEAPGTYQHSLLLANLSEAAATAIGANGTFCRVAAMYHDIGKITNPQYFNENQQGGLNMHQLLTPQESAAVIIGHVTEGVRLARENNLPQSFINIIREHHGTTLVYYFYRKALERVHGDSEQVDQKLFRYPGPKPRSKESAIIMIADTVEAASHSIDEFTEEHITTLVNDLVTQKTADGQLNHCQLTFEELTRVKKKLIKNIVLAAHKRSVYNSKPFVPNGGASALDA